MTEPRQSRAIPSHRSELADQLVGSAGLLVGLDFDGTLAPIATDPDAPAITSACRQAVSRLATHPQCRTAVISGRSLSDLRDRIGLDGIVYAGNHGLELDSGPGRIVHPIAARYQPVLHRLLPLLANRLENVPGWEIEDKGLSATVHIRRTPESRVDEVRAAVDRIVETASVPLRVASGKQVIEIRPDVDWDKGSAIRLLQSDLPHAWQTVYLGDDVTDEDAFRAIAPEGVAILVGARSDTAATYHLSTQSAVAPFLNWLVDCVLNRLAPKSA